jgi:hypothetical protein
MSKDMKSAIVLICFSLVLFFFITPKFVDDQGVSGVSPRFFPNFATLILLICSTALLAIDILTARRKSHEALSHKHNDTSSEGVVHPIDYMPLVVAGILLIYFFLFEYIGFLWTTPIVMALLMILLGQRNWKVIVASCLGMTFLFFELFRRGLGLNLL